MMIPGILQMGDSCFGGNLTAFVNNGIIPEARVDDMGTSFEVTNHLSLTYLVKLPVFLLLRQDASNYPTINFDAFRPDDDSVNQHIDVQADHDKVVREIGAASIVLLKNKIGALP